MRNDIEQSSQVSLREALRQRFHDEYDRSSDFGCVHHNQYPASWDCEKRVRDFDDLLAASDSGEVAGLPVLAATPPAPTPASEDGLRAASRMLFDLSKYARHRPGCPEANGPGDCNCGLYALLDAIRCRCGHKISVHTDRDVSDVVGWPCKTCRSGRCTGFALAATTERPAEPEDKR